MFLIQFSPSTVLKYSTSSNRAFERKRKKKKKEQKKKQKDEKEKQNCKSTYVCTYLRFNEVSMEMLRSGIDRSLSTIGIGSTIAGKRQGHRNFTGTCLMKQSYIYIYTHAHACTRTHARTQQTYLHIRRNVLHNDPVSTKFRPIVIYTFLKSGSVKKEAKGEKERKVPDEGSEGSLMNRPT